MSTIQQAGSTKFLAMVSLPSRLTEEQLKTVMPKEVPATLQLAPLGMLMSPK